MMKKTLCLLLALALCLPLLPAAALAEDGTAGEDRQLYFCRSGDEADRLTALRFAPGAYVSGFFCIIPDGETLQRIDSGVAYTPDEGSAENALTLSLAEEAENAASSFVWFNTFGAGRLVYTDADGVRYSMAAACALPDRGFSTAATLTEETYLPNDAYCPKDLSFFYVFPEGTVVTGVSAVAAHGDEPIQVQAEVLSDPSHVCRFTLTSDLFSNGVFALEVYFTLQGSDTPATAFISVRDPAPRFGFQYADFSGPFFSSLNADIRGVFLPRFGLYDQGVFQPVTVTSAVYVPEVDTRSDALAVCQTEDGWQLSALHVGQGTLHCTAADSTVYTLPVTIVLPEQGFSTGTTLTEETCLVNRSVDYVQGQVFYYVFPEGQKITAVTPTLYDDNAQVQTEILSDQPNVCRFTLTACGTAFRTALDASFQLEDGSAWTDCIDLRDPAPRFGFRLYRWDGSFSENLFRSVKTEAGFTNRLGFFLSSGDDSSLLDLASVTFLPAEGTDAGAMTATKLANGIWQLDSVLPGQGTLQCAAQDGAVYTLPVDIALPSKGFFSARRMATETYLPFYDFDEAAAEHVVWFLKADGFSAKDLANFFGWAGESKEDPLDSVERYITVEKVPWEENSGRYDIKLTIQSIPGCRLTVWPEHANGTHYVDEELEILNTKKLERLTQLDAPTDLSWAGDYPGDIRCKSGTLFQDLLLWTLYQVGNPTPLARRETAYSGRYDPDSWRVDDLFWRSYRDYPDRESGDYYFTVQAVGDEEQYKDSPVVASPIWHYERPEAELTAPTGLHWEGQTACWSDESNHAADLYGYEIQFRCVAPETEAETGTKYTLTMDELSSDGLKHTLQDWVKDLLGSGTCQFRLRAVSGDITRFRHSQWSAFSVESTQLTAPSTVAKALDQLLTDYTPSEGAELTEKQTAALKSAVAAKKDALASTLCTGGGSTKVADNLQKLEALVGGPATVTVTENAPTAITKRGVSIVGASLNGAAESAVTLKIDKAETVSAETPINPAQYHNTIPFSMTLEGVNAQEQHQSLAVPVLITLPLPGSIHPSFLVLLHKIGDTWEEIFPYQVFYDETLEQDCVRFTVTSFSDFAFAQQLSCGIQQLDAENGRLRVRAADGAVASVVAAVYDGSGKQLGCAAAAAGTAGGTLTLDLPALKTGAAVRVFFLRENGQPVCPAAEKNFRR